MLDHFKELGNHLFPQSHDKDDERKVAPICWQESYTRTSRYALHHLQIRQRGTSYLHLSKWNDHLFQLEPIQLSLS